MRHGRRKSKGMAHQPGYLEAKACRMLSHARNYVRDNDGYISTGSPAFAIFHRAYEQAVQARRAAIQMIRGGTSA